MQQDIQQDCQERPQFKFSFVGDEDRSVQSSQVLTFGDLIVNTVTHEVTRAGRHIELTATEYMLLELFMRHPRQILDRQTILHRVWGYDFLGETNIIEVYVRYLREKIEDVPGSPRLILTVRGMGYVLRA
jgi:two-component system, OmpR family, response regulator MprA